MVTGFSGSPVCMECTAHHQAPLVQGIVRGLGGRGHRFWDHTPEVSVLAPQLLSWGALGKATYPFGASPFSRVKWDQELYYLLGLSWEISEFIHLSA